MIPPPQVSTVDGIITRSARRSPDRVALAFADRTWTYEALDNAVSHAAHHMQERGLRQGDRVAAYGANSDAYLIAYLACARAGLIHVPVNYSLTGDELAYILDDSESRAILCDASLRANISSIAERVDVDFTLDLDSNEGSLLAVANRSSEPPTFEAAEDTDLVQLLYTSGTTSNPKGAIMTHRALVHEYMSSITALNFTERDNPLICMPLYHSAALHVFAMPYLAVGATVHLVQAPDVGDILRRIEADRIGSLFLAPTVWVRLAAHPDLPARDLSSLSKAQYGASIMPQPILDQLRGRYPSLGFYNCFGQSEIGPLATVLGPDEHAERSASCGRAVLFVEARIVDDQGSDVAVGEPGEIVYRSPQLCEGYWNNPSATAEAFRGGWFHSGDLVTRDAEGYITVVDRIKDVITTGGVQVAPREVEDAIYLHGAVAEVAVVGLPDDEWIEVVTAFVVTRPGSTVTEGEIIAHARSELAGYKCPKSVVFVDDLPRNASGKILKRQLRDTSFSSN